ncbi:hypothetical protein LAZ67_1000173 [Cordylochernes scorpioides]|uniref:Reverse transcriptase domain-containing protein n=1 Tax=Cordylochernes scorpioides TaxID=51811 RepID=A0ABY6JZ44_9ARAC|nr:hypothetical protein LAZ67_1000173 [Cordylochernes scorpioides]
MEAMETNNPFGVLAESQENGLQAHMNSTENPQGSTEISANESDMAESLSDSNNRKDANSEPAADGGHANSRRNWADCPELNDQLPDGEDGIFTTVGGSKKRPHDPDHVNSGAKKGCVQAPRIAPNSSRPRVTPRASRVRECQTTRQKQATFRARSAAMQADQYVYLEFCPDFTEDQYFLALEAKLGKGTVYQLTKMEGQFLVGLSGVQQADKLVEDGLEIEDALLRATPLKKRAERIMFGNVPFFVENLDLVAALQPFGQITSIVQKMKELGESYWADARREAFITLRDGVKLSHIPARLNIKAKGVTSHVYVTYGIRCSLCYKHGHKRANCPRKTGVQEANLLLHLDSPAGPNNAGGRQPSSSNVMPAPVPTPAAGPSSTAALIPDVTPEPPAAPPTPATSPAPPAAPAPAPETLPTASVDPVPPTSKQCRGGARKTHKKSNVTRTQLNELLERIHSNILDKSGLEGLEREEVLDALASVPGLKSLINKIGSEQLTALNNTAQELIDALPDSNCALYKRLSDETNTSSLDPIQHLCLGYSAATVPPAALRGSGLACFFAPGVAVLRQRVLWPGNISIVSIDVRGQEVRVINCHLSHIPRERLEQLESITAAAIQEDAWVVGDLNIDEQSPSDITSGSVEALTELMDQTALVDVATLFDAEHLPTRVASCRSRVDAARLDRILLPSRLLERVTLYKTIYYRLSDHRAILTQMGSPHSPRQPCVAAMLRSALVDEHLLATIERTSGSIADMSSEALWIRWSKIKAELLAEVRSLHVPRVADDDHISRARRYLQARLEAASSAADYPSLPDLVRSLRVRRPAGTTIRDEDGSVIDGGELRRRAYSVYQRRFACESGDPIAAAEFIRGTTTTLTLEEDDPLTRPDITGADIAAAIRRLPLGKAPGWDELPCEFLITYEDFFVEALRRVFEASKLRGALPSSIRRSTICLVPKSNGGPGLSGYRPISLPTADYRVLGNILLQRLRPHLPALVPRCQTYAVPGRSPSWNVARVADEIDLATRNGSELAVISTDLESAFDTLDRCFLVSLMVSLRLPPAFVEWFLLLYAGADAAVRAGGLHTKPFHLLNGVRQGCAISAALFSLATGPLLVRLERALGPGNVLAYADDIVLLIRRDELFDVVRIIFEDFRRASGIGVNFAKCKGLWCGAWRARTDTQLGISWTSEQIRVLGCNLTPAVSSSAQEQHLLALLESAVARWVPFTRGLSLFGRARAANSLVLSAVVHHLHGYLPTDSTIAKLQARLVRFVWGPRRTTWLPGGVLARPVSMGGFGLLDIRTQLRLACLRGVQTALRGGLNAYSWLAVSGTWLTPPTSGTWHPPRRRRLLKLWEAVSEILELNHRVLPPHQLQELHIIGDSRFLRPPDLLVASRWAGMRVGDLTSSSSLPLRTTRAALADIAALTTFCSRIVEENRNHTHRVDNIKDGIVLRGTATAFQRLTTRTARRMLERPRLAALPITQLLARWLPHVSIPISISWPSLRRGAFSGHNADVAVRLALHALPHPAHPASARESCIACGSVDLSLAHRYWSCRRIRPVILEAFTIIQRSPDLQGWIFGLDLEDDALAILASAKTRIYRHFLGLEIRGVQEDPLIVWRRTLATQMTLAESHPSSTSADAISTPQTPVVTVGHTKEPEPGTGKPSTSWADLVEQGKQLPMEGQDDGFILVSHERKRPSETAAEGQSKRGRVQSAATRPTAVPSANKPRVQRCTKTLQKQAEFRAKSAAGQVDQCVYLEFSPEFSQAQYFLALEAKLGKGCVYQMSKMEGHIIVALSSVKLAERLIEEGLDIESANLRAFPLRKKAERIALGNVLFFITDADLIAALRPYGRVTSIVQQMMELENSCWADTRREAFITLHDGVRLSQIPARLEIKAKGMISSVYVSYGIRCSLCHRQGHKRANCPQKTGMTEDKLLFPERTPVTRPIAWSKPLDSSSQASPAAAPTSAAEIPPPPTATAVAIPPPSDEVERTNEDSSPPYNTQELPLSQDKRNLAQKQMDALMKNAKASEAIASVQKEHEIDICFLQETNVMSLDDVGDLCQGYSAVVAPATTTVGSGLACVFAAGVVVHRQQILWPGKMAVIDLTVRGISVTCVNAHVSHAPEERCRQLQIIAALAREEGAWILGDLNISEESAKDLASGSAESLAELLDQADLVDVATFFDAALEHTRVATIGSRVDARRLDRILLPSGFCDRVTQYQTVDYAYSDHRAVLIQVGDPAPTRLLCIGKLLRSDLFVDRMETFIDEISVDLANLSPPMLWEKWTRIKANLVAEIRSLAPAVAESGGGYIERASLFLRRRLEDDTARSDYPSLSDLGRSLRARRRSPSTFTDDDGNAISGGQLRRFLLERLSSRFAQAPSSEEAIADFLAEVTPLEFDEWDQLFLADISRDQIAAAIHRLPNGRASGWDGLPCEFVKAFEDFFAEVLWQVFEASRLRGALPPSSRRSKVILLPKVHGGPGLQAFRPISLPTTDYRVLSGVLMARLRRHLPDLVPQCQTYAVPGRSSSWNIARVSDEAAGASRHDTPLAVISLDLKSAFDTLSRSYLFALLEKLGLPSTFLGWIAVLYGEADASIRVGDVYTKVFPLLNGVRQGCRLSAALFSIGVGPLLRRLERTLGRGNVVAYADDIVLFIRDDAQFELVPLIFEEFRMSSGVAINFKKSCGLWCGCTITTRNTVASQASHLMGLLEQAIARWSPFTRGLSLVGRARAANSLVLGSILHHLHGYLPPETTVGRLQARLARFVWGTSRVSWLPGRILARPVSDGGVGLLDIAGQLRLACLKGVQASLRGAANGYSWLVRSRAWLTPPAPDVWHSPRRRRLLSLWEAASSVLELDHRVLHPASLRSLRLRGDNRFLRPPDLLTPERWLQATVGDFSDGAPALARSTRAALLDAQYLGAFCQRLLRENASSSYHAEYEAETIVLRGSATPITRLPSQRARRALDSARLQAFPTAELAARWTPTVDVPRSIPWADLRRNCFSGHDADVALRLALHALPHPDHPASRRANCATCGSSDGSLAHRYWSCRAVRPLLREVFASCEVPLDLQAWLFGVGLHPEAVKLTSVAKATIYKGVVHHEFLPQGRTVNKEYYLQVMRNLREAIRQKRPDLWKNKNWLLHHDNAPAHTSLLVRDFLAKNNTLMMPQPPYSPDLAPCDFFLFPKLKRPMKGRRYATLDEIKTASKEELKKILKKYFLKCFED